MGLLQEARVLVTGLVNLISPNALLYDLPKYLARYVRTRHSGIDDLAKIVPENELVASYIQERDELGLRYLAETASALTYSRATFQALLDDLSSIDSLEYPPLVVGEIANRAHSLTDHEQLAVADTLFSLSIGELPPRSRVLVDRAILRILPRFTSEPGRRLALQSFMSSRAVRRHAAVKFYRTNGLDDKARRRILDQVGSGETEAPELIATDTELIEALGLEYALIVAPSTFYRKRAVEVAMGFMTAPLIAEFCFDYPQELVWAVHDQCSREYGSIIVALATRYQSDPYLLNRIVQCVAKVGDDRQLEFVIAIAKAALGHRTDTRGNG